MTRCEHTHNLVDRVLVTDASYRNTLAVMRAIARDNEVHVGSDKRLACGFYSRFAKGTMVYDVQSAEAFASSVDRYMRESHIQYLLPIGDLCCFYAAQFARGIPGLVPMPDARTMLIARDKVKMIERASRLRIKVPRIMETVDGFPVVLKPVAGSGNLRFVNNRIELREAEEYYRRRGVDHFVTEYIDGDENFSYAALVNRGSVKAFFMYREKREYPLTGGSASFATSSYDARVKEQCEKILKDLNWNGVAMIEFKIGTDHEMHFMELNPKFWASLELAVASGVNFPTLLIRMARGEKVEQPPYKLGVAFRWIIEDTLHFLSRPEKGVFNHLEPSFVDVHLDDLPAHIMRMVGELHRAATSGSRLGYRYGMPRKIESAQERVR